MKLIRYILLTISVIAVSSCDLELQDDPNAIPLSKVNATLLLNRVQVDFATVFNGASTFGMQTTRMMNSGGSDYTNMHTPTTFDNTWTNAYASVLNDIHVLLPVADAGGMTRHAGIARVLQAYTLLMLVDYFGDVPFDDAFQGLTNPNPEAEDDASLYTKAIAILDQAITNFGTAPSPSAPAVNDFYYSSNFGNWVRLANTIKLKAYLNMRVSDQAGATTAITALIAHPGGFISSATENFVFRYATNSADPDSRHPRWTNNWLTGANDYMSNYFMWQMNFGYGVTDPRMRFYFYRQRNANSSNPNEIRCVLEQVPAHYPQLAGGAVLPGEGGLPPGIDPNPANAAWVRTFCFPTGAGYWGRDHVDPQGIPPDGLARTTWGSYPAGGRFDANNALPVNNASTPTNSMRGAGFQPIMMRSFVDFMFAEAANYLGITPPGVNNTAQLRFEAGIRNSMTDVRGWAVSGTFGSNSFGPSPTQTATIEAFQSSTDYQTAVTGYVTSALTSYAAQADNNGRMNYIAREYWISLFGNGIEAYNLYRRTGMPSGMQPTITPSSNVYPRTFWYPVVYEARNANAEQKSNLTVRVFWDTDLTNLDF